MQVSAATFGQRITMSRKNISLKTVLRELTKQSGYGFFYDGKAIGDNQKVTVVLSNAEFDEALKSVLTGLNLSYKIDGNIVSIRKIEEPSLLDNLIARFQAIDVSGRVVDVDGRGLPGASVSVKGKGNKAVSTGTNGSFYLKGVNEDATLIISFIGYVTKEIKAAKELGDVVLELSTSKLDEVQVIAYGTTTQRLSTGNVTTIKADVIEKQPVNNPLLALQGRVPGLFIEQATGFAGTGVKVRIQGQNSMNFGNDPFYVIDGVPYSPQLFQEGNSILGNSGITPGIVGGTRFGNPLNFINPADIESIDVLKDADATAIYGSRAANGAILITTKKGKDGDTELGVNLQSGWAVVPRRLDLMNSEEYLQMRREALRNDGIVEPLPGPYGDSDLNGNWDNSRYTDWQKELIGGTASYQDLNATLSGGGQRTAFLVATGYHRETNVFPGDFSDSKASLHFNINNESLNRRFKIQFSGTYLFNNSQLPNVDITANAMMLVPVAPALFHTDGTINWASDTFGSTTFLNPMGYQYNEFNNKSINLIGNMMLNYQIISGLNFQSSFGYTSLHSNTTNKTLLKSYYPEQIPYASRSTIFSDNKTNSWTIEPQIIFNHKINKGKLEVLIGTTILQNDTRGYSITGLGFSNDLVMDDILSAPAVSVGSSNSSRYKYNAVFSRINYNWEDKYIFNLTGRRDGSSRFGSRSQFHNFAALGIAWIFSNLKVIQNNLSFLSFGKLRASYGTTGSDQIGDYQFLSLYSPVPQDVPYQGIPNYQPNGIANPYLEWEETKKLQFGLDLGFLKDRILFGANYYENRSSNQLSNYSLPKTAGFNVIAMNQAYKIQNSGWEMVLSTTNTTKGFLWSSSFNLTVPNSRLIDYPDLVKSSVNSTAVIGKPLSSIRLFHFLGVNPSTGVYEFADKDGNPTITPNDLLDKTVIIDLAPKFYGGIQNTVTIRNFQLDFLFSYVKQIAQNNAFGNGTPGMFSVGNGNQLASLSGRWKKPGDFAVIQRFSTGTDLDQSLSNVYQSDAAWSDASYLRLKNLSISWTIPARWKKAARLENCRLFLQGQNLWTLTGYSGLDPETKSSNTLPPLRVITLGVKASL